MYKCTNRYCKQYNVQITNEEADLNKGECKLCRNSQSDEKGFGWAYNDSLRPKPLRPDSMQSLAAAKARGEVPVAVVATPVRTPPLRAIGETDTEFRKRYELWQKSKEA